jgi:hypothetical protein
VHEGVCIVIWGVIMGEKLKGSWRFENKILINKYIQKKNHKIKLMEMWTCKSTRYEGERYTQSTI